MTAFLAIILMGVLVYLYNKAKTSNIPRPITKSVEQPQQEASYFALFIKGIVGLFAILVTLIFIGAIIAPEKMPTPSTKPQPTRSDSYYSWASKVDKETCDKIALVGMNKGSRDRMVAIRDCNNMDFAFSFCPDCSSSEKGEVATCYEIGYDRGYYGR